MFLFTSVKDFPKLFSRLALIAYLILLMYLLIINGNPKIIRTDKNESIFFQKNVVHVRKRSQYSLIVVFILYICYAGFNKIPIIGILKLEFINSNLLILIMGFKRLDFRIFLYLYDTCLHTYHTTLK